MYMRLYQKSLAVSDQLHFQDGFHSLTLANTVKNL
jgi:hypothetical protein